MRPLFFETEGFRLFAAYHPAPRAAEAGVVLCQPVGQEYMRAHRSFVRLADTLAGKGLPTLRFDYRGCGDSAGDVQDWSVAAWGRDVDAATTKLRALSGVSSVYIVGLRLGGAIAVVGAGRLATKRLVLWDPVVRGSAYLTEIQGQHDSWLAGSLAVPESSPASEVEILGFTHSEGFRAELHALDLTQLEYRPAESVLLVGTTVSTDAPTDDGASLEHGLEFLGCEIKRVHTDDRPVWEKAHDELSKILWPRGALSEIVTWLATHDATPGRSDPPGRSSGLKKRDDVV